MVKQLYLHHTAAGDRQVRPGGGERVGVGGGEQRSSRGSRGTGRTHTPAIYIRLVSILL